MTARVELVLMPSTEAAGLTRRWVEEQVEPQLSDEAAANLKLVASELVTNAVAHGDGAITVRLELLDDVVRIEVIDTGDRSAPAIRRTADEGGGYGLRLVDALSQRWGVYDGSTHVWADIVR